MNTCIICEGYAEMSQEICDNCAEILSVEGYEMLEEDPNEDRGYDRPQIIEF